MASTHVPPSAARTHVATRQPLRMRRTETTDVPTFGGGFGVSQRGSSSGRVVTCGEVASGGCGVTAVGSGVGGSLCSMALSHSGDDRFIAGRRECRQGREAAPSGSWYCGHVPLVGIPTCI